MGKGMAVNPADIAWVLTSTALVMLMTPALAFFYGGLVRRKNLVSTLVQCIAIFAVVSLVWFFWGYSLVFGPSVGGCYCFLGSLCFGKVLEIKYLLPNRVIRLHHNLKTSFYCNVFFV